MMMSNYMVKHYLKNTPIIHHREGMYATVRSTTGYTHTYLSIPTSRHANLGVYLGVVWPSTSHWPAHATAAIRWYCYG